MNYSVDMMREQAAFTSSAVSRRGLPYHPITEHEWEVMRQYALWGRQKEVAAYMGLSLQTVKNTLTTVYAKLGAESSIEAFRLLGWLRIP